MKIKKTLFSLILILVSVLSFSACNSNEITYNKATYNEIKITDSSLMDNGSTIIYQANIENLTNKYLEVEIVLYAYMAGQMNNSQIGSKTFTLKLNPNTNKYDEYRYVIIGSYFDLKNVSVCGQFIWNKPI